MVFRKGRLLQLKKDRTEVCHNSLEGIHGVLLKK